MIYSGMVLVSAFFGGAQAPMAAASVAAALAVPPGQQSEDPDRIVCRRIQPGLGSRIAPRRVCRRAREWEGEARDHQEAWEQRHRPPSGN